MIEVLRGNAERLTFTSTDFAVTGALVDADGAVTVTVTNEAGTVLVNAHAATQVGTGTYTYDLAAQANLDQLTIVASGTFSGLARTATQVADVVGGYYLTVADMRALKNLDNETKFPDADLVAARRWFETKFERYTGRAFVPRYRRIVAWGTGTDSMVLPDQNIRTLRTVRFGTVNLSDAALANIALEGSGRIQHFWPLGINGPDDSFGVYGSIFPLNARVTVTYEYGLAEAPEDVVEAAKVAIAVKLVTDLTGNREISVQTELGIVRMSYPGPDRPFGIPFCDETANDRRRPDRQRDILNAGTVPIG